MGWALKRKNMLKREIEKETGTPKSKSENETKLIEGKRVINRKGAQAVAYRVIAT